MSEETQDAPLVRREIHFVVAPKNIVDLQKMATSVAAAKMYGMKNADEAFVIMMTGMELNLSPMQSLRAIHCWGGKPVLSADLMVALVRQSPLCDFFEMVSLDDSGCEYHTRRAGAAKAVSRTYTMVDAKKAGLLTKDVWQKHPKDMLRARAASKLARQEYPEVCLGLYTADEQEDAEQTGQVFEAEIIEPEVIHEADAKLRVLAAVKEATGMGEMDATERALAIWKDAALMPPFTAEEIDSLIASHYGASAVESEPVIGAEEDSPTAAGASPDVSEAEVVEAVLELGQVTAYVTSHCHGKPLRSAFGQAGTPHTGWECQHCALVVNADGSEYDRAAECMPVVEPIEAHTSDPAVAVDEAAEKHALFARAEAWSRVEMLILASGATGEQMRDAVDWLGTKGEVDISEWTQALKEADEPATLVADMAHKWAPPSE